jgi:hypothetical protein
MKKIILAAMIVIPNLTYAGTFLEKGMYISNDVAVGFGTTKIQAAQDAEKSVPSSYKISSILGSPAIQCSGDNIWNEKNECGSESVRYVLPVVKR